VLGLRFLVLAAPGVLDVEVGAAEPDADEVAAIVRQVFQPRLHAAEVLGVPWRLGHVEADGDVRASVGEFEVPGVARANPNKRLLFGHCCHIGRDEQHQRYHQNDAMLSRVSPHRSPYSLCSIQFATCAQRAHDAMSFVLECYHFIRCRPGAPGVGKFCVASSSTSTQSLSTPQDGGEKSRVPEPGNLPISFDLPSRGLNQ